MIISTTTSVYDRLNNKGMKIDRRKKAQYFKNMYGLNDVYVHKDEGRYSVGINGTSHHHVKLPHHKAELMVTVLVMQRG